MIGNPCYPVPIMSAGLAETDHLLGPAASPKQTGVALLSPNLSQILQESKGTSLCP